MTLLVHTYVRGRSGQGHFLEDPEHGLTLAGFESSRTRLRGSRTVRDLGARFFPEPATADLCVDPEDVTAFLAECELLRGHVAALAAHSGYVAARLANITAAALRARDVDGESSSGERVTQGPPPARQFVRLG
nr:hypothetical protein OG461_24625 [Streptomyces sp. NBC_00995]